MRNVQAQQAVHQGQSDLLRCRPQSAPLLGRSGAAEGTGVVGGSVSREGEGSSAARREGWLAADVKTSRWRFSLVAALGLLTLLSTVMLMFTSGFLISKSALRPENILLVYVPIVGVRTFGIARAVLQYAQRLSGHDAVLRILSRMRSRLYRVLEPQALFLSSRYRKGDLLGLLAEDIDSLQNVYIRTVFPAVTAVMMYLIVIVAAEAFSRELAGLAALYLTLLIGVLPYVSYRLTRRRHRLLQQQRGGLYRKLADAVMGIGDWVISGRYSRFAAAYAEDEAAVLHLERRLRSWSRWRACAGQMIVGAAVMTALCWAGRQYAGGHLEVTLIAAFVLVVFPLMDAFLPVSEAVERIPQYQDSLERLARMETGNGAEIETPRQVIHDFAHKTEAAAFTPVHLQLDKVTYRYYTGPEELSSPLPAVSGVELDLPQGKRVAVIGRSGAGKSTLLKLIQGALTPSGGRVTMNGEDAVQFEGRMSEWISVLNQSPHLFDTTVGNNIRLGRLEATDEELRMAVEAAQLGPLVDSLPEGLDTRMLETGQRFSGGERQRIALARLLLQNTPVVILDEPTLGLDPRTERELMAAIVQATAGKTLIWVTHHLIGARHMDEIIFMDEGQVILRGSHEELMRSSERYRRLYEMDRLES
jgi:ATP-binding cassette, subfamily C, bacterial CydC